MDEPLRMAELTDLERCAAGTYWRHIGMCIDVPYYALPSSMVGWTDGLHFLEELEIWSMDLVSTLRRYSVRNFMLPRPSFLRVRWFSKTPDAACCLHAGQYVSHPWYVQPTFLARWGPRAMITRIFGRVLPGDEGAKYEPRGYRLHEMGSDAFKNRGTLEMEETRRKLRDDPRGGRPFAAW